MAINYVCRCGKKMCLSDALAAKKIMCPACKNWAIVPDPGQAVPLTPVEELAAPMMITTIEEPGKPAAPEEAQLIPLDEDDEGGTYGLNREDAALESRLRGGPSADSMQFAGELAC